MANKKEKDPYGINQDTGFACSAQDCTGLIPALPESEEQIERYQELFPYMAKAEKEVCSDEGEKKDKNRG